MNKEGTSILLYSDRVVSAYEVMEEWNMWHVETDIFALAVFLIMLIKESALRRERK